MSPFVLILGSSSCPSYHVLVNIYSFIIKLCLLALILAVIAAFIPDQREQICIFPIEIVLTLLKVMPFHSIGFYEVYYGMFLVCKQHVTDCNHLGQEYLSRLTFDIPISLK